MYRVLLLSNLCYQDLGSGIEVAKECDIKGARLDAVLVDKERLASFKEATKDSYFSLFKIALINKEEELEAFKKSGFEVWLGVWQIQRLGILLDEYKELIEKNRRLNSVLKICESIFVANGVHIENLEMIKRYMHESAEEIKKIFSEQVIKMKDIHIDITHTRNQIDAIDISITSKEEIGTIVTKADDIIKRTDEVIKAMYNFVTILQCEDRITQMIDGIMRIVEDGITRLRGCQFVIDEGEIEMIKAELVRFYTIQSQRDMVLGKRIEGDNDCLKTVDIDNDEFTLF